MKKKLKEICEVKQSKTTSLDDDKVWILNLDKIESHTGKILKYEYSKRTELGQSICQFDENTVLYSKLRPYLNKVVLPTEKGFATSELVPLVPKENITRKYLAAFLRSNHFVSLITDKVAGTKMPRVVMKDFFEVEIPVPTLSDQQKIAAELDTIQSAIDNKKQQLALLDEAVKSKFVEMFGENPVESGKWKVEILGEVCSSIVRGPFGSALKKDFFVPKSDKTIKVYEQKHAIQKSSTIGSYYITQEKYEELKRFECKPGDFIMSCSGTMGEFYQLPEGCEKGIINQALCKFTLNEKLEPLFFFEWMKQSIHNLETRGSGIKNVAAVSFVKQMPMIIPSNDIQRRYTNFVQQIDKSKSLVKQQIADLQELLDSKMQEYFGE